MNDVYNANLHILSPSQGLRYQAKLMDMITEVMWILHVFVPTKNSLEKAVKIGHRNGHLNIQKWKTQNGMWTFNFDEKTISWFNLSHA